MNRSAVRPTGILLAFGLLAATVLATAGKVARNTLAASAVEEPASAKLDPAGWSDRKLTIANLGHATLAMNYYGVRVISDPTLFDRVGLAFDSVLTIGPRRHIAPPLTASGIGAIDVILITHAHMDHLDIPSLEALPKTATVIACAKCAALIRPLGFSEVRELNWGESTTVKGLTVTAMPARHWGTRWPPFGIEYGFNSYVLDRDGHRMLLACDSAYTDVFGNLASHPPEVAAFSIGAYDPWIHNHANPEQVWTMFRQSHARYLIPIHWGTFRLSKEPMDQPMSRLVAAAGESSNEIVLRQIGATWTAPEAAVANTDHGEPIAHAGR